MIIYLLSPLQQWASLYQPLTFSSELSPADAAGDGHLNKLDPTKAFRGKAKVPAPKKKQSAQSSLSSTAKGQGSTGRHSGVKRWGGSHSRTCHSPLWSKWLEWIIEQPTNPLISVSRQRLCSMVSQLCMKCAWQNEHFQVNPRRPGGVTWHVTGCHQLWLRMKCKAVLFLPQTGHKWW